MRTPVRQVNCEEERPAFDKVSPVVGHGGTINRTLNEEMMGIAALNPFYNNLTTNDVSLSTLTSATATATSSTSDPVESNARDLSR